MKMAELLKGCLVAGAALLLAIPALSAESGVAEDSLREVRRESGKFFDELQVVSLKIRLDQQHLGRLQKSYTNLAVYVPAEVRHGGEVFSRVGLRLRGVSTFQTVSEKPNFTLKFNEFVANQKIFGLRKIRLSNAAMDGSYLQEWLASQMFASAGVATPRVNFARVEFNGRDLGLYILIEGVTKDFLRLNWGTDRGSVYEADEVDIDGGMEQDYGERNRHQSDLSALVEATANSESPGRWQRLQEAVDVRLFASYVAVEVLLNLWDGYSLRLNNYRIFCNHDDRKAYFIPHGLDRIFEDPRDPIQREWKGRVTRTLLSSPEGRQRYLDRLQELTRQLMEKEFLFRRLDQAAEVIRPTLTELGLDRRQWRAQFLLKKRIEQRIEVLKQELPQQRKPVQAAAGS
jgi:spore coat protein H